MFWETRYAYFLYRIEKNARDKTYLHGQFITLAIRDAGIAFMGIAFVASCFFSAC